MTEMEEDFVCSAGYADALRSWTPCVGLALLVFKNFIISHSMCLLFSSVCDIFRGQYKSEYMRFASNKIILNFGVRNVSQKPGS